MSRETLPHGNTLLFLMDSWAAWAEDVKLWDIGRKKVDLWRYEHGPSTTSFFLYPIVVIYNNVVYHADITHKLTIHSHV